MSIAEIDSRIDLRGRLVRIPATLWVGIGVYLLLLMRANNLLNDGDTLWQIKVGQHILDTLTLPYVDIYSFTRAGAPWISSSWFAQVLFAKAYAIGGWNGVVILSAAAIVTAFMLFVHLLGRRWPAVYCAFVAFIALALSAQHFLARPHVLAMPVMVAWIGGLISASDRRVAPSFWLLPLMVLWVNLHGSFVFGLALIAPIMLDAVWNADAAQRRMLAPRWIAFGVCALAAACVTPYGWRSLAAAKAILSLGAMLPLISEWAPPNFARFGLFEGCVLLLIGASLWRGVRLTPPRILLVLGLLHMGLSHVRNVEIFALLMPLMLAVPLAQQFGWSGTETRGRWTAPALISAVVAACLLLGATSAMTLRPREAALPSAALATLKAHGAKRILNDDPFGGAMIWEGMAPYIDGRAELYGETFGVDAYNALMLVRPGQLLSTLDTYRIDATLLAPGTPAAGLMDHLQGWTKVFDDGVAVVHVRTGTANGSPRIR